MPSFLSNLAQRNSETTWRGKLGYFFIVQSIIFLLSFIALIVGAVSTGLSGQYDDYAYDDYYYYDYGYNERNKGVLFAYYILFPLITCIWVAIDMFFFLRAKLNAIYQLVASLCFMGGWCTMIAFWLTYDPGLYHGTATFALYIIRAIMAGFLIVGYFTAMVYSAIAVDRSRIRQIIKQIRLYDQQESERRAEAAAA